MPLYEYRCEGCGEVVELLVGFSSADDPGERCPVCGGKLKRIFSVVAGASPECEGCTATSCDG